MPLSAGLLRLHNGPHEERDDGTHQDRWHEVARHGVGDLLNRRTAPLGVGNHVDDAG